MSNLPAIERALKVAQERARMRTRSGYAAGGEVEPGLFDQIGQTASDYAEAMRLLMQSGAPVLAYEQSMGRSQAPETQGPGVAGTTVDMQPQQFGLGSEQIPVAMGGRDMVAVSEDDAGNLYNAAGEVIGNQAALQRKLDEEARAQLDQASWYERPVAKAFATMPEPMQEALSMPATLLAMPEIMAGAGKQKFDTAFPKPDGRAESTPEEAARYAGRFASIPSALIEGVEMTARDANAKLYDEYMGNRVLSDDERARAIFDIASLTPAATAATGAARAGTAGPRGWRAQANTRAMAPEEALAAVSRSDPEAQAAFDADMAQAYGEDSLRPGINSAYGYLSPEAIARFDDPNVPVKSYNTTDLAGREGEGSPLMVDPSQMGRIGIERADASFDLREGDVGNYQSDVPGVAALPGAEKLAGPDGINLDYADILMNMQRPAKLFSGSDEASIPGVVVAGAERPKKSRGLPMDESSRRTRAEEMGHFEQPFYHGTTHDIKPTKGFADPTRESGPYESESHHGRAVYTTTDRMDANSNYAGTGPDLANKLSRNAEQGEWDVKDWSPEDRTRYTRIANRLSQDQAIPEYYDKGDLRLAYAKAYSELVGKNPDGVTHKLSINPQNPVYLGEFNGKRETYIENPRYNVEEMEDGTYAVRDPEGDVVETFADESQAYDYADEQTYSVEPPLMAAMRRAGVPEEAQQRIMEEAIDGIPASKFEQIIRNDDSVVNLIDEGRSPGQVIQDVYRELGYDAVVLPDASAQFTNMGIGRGTAHVAIFDNRRLRDWDKAKFDPKKKDSTSLLAANRDEAIAPGVVSAADRMRRNQPFYGEDVGPAGRIADPVAEARRLAIKSGLAGAPSESGFFNPATSALLQQGVAPKNTVAYFKKQMGARGGKLPPGMWEKATEGLRPSDVIERDWLVQQIDDLSPQIDLRRFSNLHDDGAPRLPSDDVAEVFDHDQYGEYATRGPFENYTETAVGYPKPKYGSDIDPAVIARDPFGLGKESPGKVDTFTDSHFDHPNLEGWYRTQDAKGNRPVAETPEIAQLRNAVSAARQEYDSALSAAADKAGLTDPYQRANLLGVRSVLLDQGKTDVAKAVNSANTKWGTAQSRLDEALTGDPMRTRIIEEVQPQRNEKIREIGPARTPAEIKALKDQERAILTELDPIFMRAVGMSGRGLAGSFDARGVAGLRHTLEARAQTASAQGDSAAAAEMLAMSRQLGGFQEKLANIEGKLRAAQEGVNPSPFSHSVNDATDILLKNAIRDAVVDDVDRVAWAPGEVQASRYNQIKKVKSAKISEPVRNADGSMARELDLSNQSGVVATARVDLNGKILKGYDAFRDAAGENISKYLGPDLAAKLLRSEGPKELRDLNVQFGGEGMKGYYGSGPTAKDGILPARVKSLVQRVTGKEPGIDPANIPVSQPRTASPRPPNGWSEQYPSFELTPEFKEKARKIGLSLYANDEKAGLIAGAVAASKIPKEIDAYGFYSPSLEAIKVIPQQKGTVGQFRSMILDKKYGGKPKELQAVGFDRAFPDPDAKVTRQQVEDFLRQNRVELESKVYGEETFADVLSRVQAMAKDPNSAYHGYAKRALREYEEGDDSAVRGFHKAETEERTRFERYSTPGGERYRETVKSLKGKEGEPFTHRHWPSIDNPVLHYRTKDFKSRPDSNSKTRVVEEFQSDAAQLGRKKGFADPQEAARLQVEYNNLSQKRIALEDEMQEILLKPEYASEQGAIAAIWDYMDSQHGIVGANELVQSPNALATFLRRAAPFMDEADVGLGLRLAEELANNQNQRMDISEKRRAAKEGVPEMPYTGNTSDWVDRAWKEALIEAARDPSIAEIAWAPGSVQNKHYNLSQHVDEIVVRPMMEGTREVVVDMPANGKLNFRVNSNGIIKGVPQGMLQAMGQPLSSLIGEGLAQQAMETSRPLSIRGDNLNIGGEKMDKFYGVVGPDGTVVEPGIVGRRLQKLIEGLDPEAARIGQSEVGSEYALWKEQQGIGRELGRGPMDRMRDAQAAYDGELRQVKPGYPSIQMTDTLRQKILDEGFGLFANRDEALLPGLLPALDSADGPITANEVIDIQTPQNRVLKDGFYSVLDENIANSQMKAGTAAQWLNATKKGETAAKDSEIKWRGFDRFLASKKPNEKITKEEIQQYLADNEVEVTRYKNTDEGFDPEMAREREIENVREDLRYNSEEDIVDRYGLRIVPILTKMAEEARKSLTIEPVGNLDLYSSEPLYQVLGQDGKTLSRGYRTMQEAEVAASKHAEELAKDAKRAEIEERDGKPMDYDPMEGITGYQIVDEDGNPINDRDYATLELAKDQREDIIMDREMDSLREMSDDDLANLTGDDFEGYRQRTKSYMNDVPKGGRDYVEDVLTTDPKTIARLGSKGWPKNRGDLHPDANYENAAGWTLREEYGGEALGKGSGIALHEAQSRWGQAGEGGGWKNNLSPEEIAQIEAAANEAVSRAFDLETQYVGRDMNSIKRTWSSGAELPEAVQAYRILNNDLNTAQIVAERLDTIERRGNALQQQMNELTEAEQRIADELARGPVEEMSTGMQLALTNWQRKIDDLKEKIIEDQQRVATSQDVLNRFEAEGRIARVAPEDIARPDSEYSQWYKEVKDARLRAHEARNKLDAAKKGVDPGPFVDDQAAFPLLLKQALIDAANEGNDWVALAGPKRIARRWGKRGAEDKYEKAGPNILGKLAKMHDKGAKVEPVYPGSMEKPKGTYTSQDSIRNEQLAYDLDTQDSQAALPLEGQPTRPQKSAFESTQRMVEVALDKDYNGRPRFYLLNEKQAADAAAGKRIYPDVGPFDTREHAERAMKQLNRSLEKQIEHRASLTPEQLIAQGWDQGEAYSGVRLSPQARESIKKRGFPLFANKDEAALPVIVTSAAGEKAIKELTPRQLDDLGLYSHLGETLDTVEMKNATPLKWRSEFKNKGVKPEELRWTGMDKWLASLPQNEKVSVDQLKAYFAENKVKLEKHHFDEDGYTDEQVRDSAYESLETYNYTTGIDPDWLSQHEARFSIVPDPDNEGMFAIMDEDGEVIGNDYATEKAAQRDIDAKVKEDAEDFGEWAVFDESNEVISSGFSSERNADEYANSQAYEDAQESIDSLTTEELRKQQDMPAGEQSSTHLEDRVEGGKNYSEHIMTVPQSVLKRGGVDKPGIDAHFRDDVDNVLGWNLMEDYEDIPTGGRVKMIHENQSDWGQRGSDQGFATAPPEQIKAAQDAYADADQAWRNEASKFVEISGGGGVARILTGDNRDARNIGMKLTNKFDTERDMRTTQKEIERIEQGGATDDSYVRSKLSALYNRIAVNEDYLKRLDAELAPFADRYRMLDLSEAGMQPDSPTVGDVRDWAQWKTTTDDLRLKKQEAEQKMNALTKGVAEGPFVTDPADWTRLTLKNALYEAAKRGDKYLAWSDPDTLNERWSGHEAGMNEHYGKRIPNIMQKLAKEHDPDAKLTSVYPGAPYKPQGEYYEGPNYRNTESRLPDLPFAEMQDKTLYGPFDGQYAQGQALHAISYSPIKEIVMGAEMVSGDKRPVYYLQTENGKRINPSFRSREAAEAAMTEINRRLESKQRPTREELDRKIEEEDGTKKFQAVEITDRMRDSIKKRGFRMFNQPREAFLAGIAPAMSDREAKIERALKIAGAKKPKSKREIN